MQFTITALENQIPVLMERTQVVGLSIALINDAQLVWHQGFGFKQAATRAPVTVETVFEAASLSKPVFAYAVLQLCAAGLLDLDRPLSHYLAAPYLAEEPRLQLITARHVLSHSPGFPNWRPKDQPLQIHFRPGERFSYSGEGYVYLERVVETLTGQSLAAYSQQVVFAPFGMIDSSYVWLDRYEQQAADAYDDQGAPAEKFKPTEANAAYTLHTTPTDFARFMLAFLGLARERIASETVSLCQAMLSPQIQANNLAPWNPAWPSAPWQLTPAIYWGLGWGLERSPQANTFWHWGDNGAFKAFALGAPEQGSGLIVMTTGGRPRELWPALIQTASGADHPALAWLDTVYAQMV